MICKYCKVMHNLEYQLDPECIKFKEVYLKPILNIKVVSYYKYTFNIDVLTEDGIINISCGGSSEGIYKFDPFGGWYEWFGSNINSVYLNGVDIYPAKLPLDTGNWCETEACYKWLDDKSVCTNLLVITAL